MSNKAAYVLENRSIGFGEEPMPVPGPHEILVRMVFCGICGSDVHFYKDGEPDFPDVYPFVIGHEGAGEVVEVGAEVTSLAVGDRVALEPGIPCRRCTWCIEGRYNLCADMVFPSYPPHFGLMRQYVTHPAEMSHRLPDNVSTLEGALIEPLAVGMTSVRTSGIRYGQSAAILGSGCIGLVTMLSLRAMGIDDITVVDLFDIRLEKALELGATRVINATGIDAVQAVRAAHDGLGPDVVFETAGSIATASQTVPMVKRGGTVMIIGNVVGRTPFNLQMMTDREINLRTNFRYHNMHPTAINAVATGRIDVSRVVTRVYPFDETPAAFEDSINGKETMVKAVLQVAETPAQGER